MVDNFAGNRYLCHAQVANNRNTKLATDKGKGKRLTKVAYN